MGRDGADRVVDAQLVQGHDTQHHQDTAQCTPDSGGQCAGSGRLGSDHHQAGDGAVQQHGQVSLAEHQACCQQGGNGTTGGGSVGVQEYHGYGVGAGDIAQFQHRATVEAEPAQPQDEGTQGSQRHVGTREGADFAVGAVLAFTGTQQENTGQGSCSTSHVYDAGAGEVAEAQVAQVVQAEHVFTTPGPCPLKRVDYSGHDHREDQEGPQLHALGNRTGDDGHGGSHKHHLEEEVCCTGVDGAAGKAVFTGSEVTQNAVYIHIGNAGEEHVAAIHDGVSAYHVHGAGNGKQGHVLGQDFGCVLGTHQAGFEHGKASRHPHN